MITLRRSDMRGHAHHGWLDTWHTFTFADYYDPAHMHFRSLRVLNEDWIAPGRGFGMHPHRDMEIVTYMMEGALEHRDSMGNGAVLHVGEVQRMTAGTGIQHSEFNASLSEPARLIQIWILPAEKGLKPGYGQTRLPADFSSGLFAIAGPQGEGGAGKIHQDVRISVARLLAGEEMKLEIAPGRYGWGQITQGRLTCGGVKVSAGDGVAVEEETEIVVAASASAEFLWFDLA
ncbi:MAG: pirin family protein [candidate division Zixibacteria bacterium]|nr:pirin family protein [candidate division Zixibacteria bacterium]